MTISMAASPVRAELTAVLHCLESEPDRLHIKTDSRYVQLGIDIWRHKWRSKALYRTARMVLTTQICGRK